KAASGGISTPCNPPPTLRRGDEACNRTLRRAAGAAKKVLERELELPELLLGGVVRDAAHLVALDRLQVAHRRVDLLEQILDLDGLDRLPGPVPLVQLLVALLDLLDERLPQRVEEVHEAPVLGVVDLGHLPETQVHVGVGVGGQVLETASRGIERRA